jgi:ATP-dependent Clp protease ATP-binding subunit ClpC
MGYGFTVTPEAKIFLADKGYSTKFGARPLKRAIQNHVEDRLAEIMIDDKLKQGDMLTISVENDETIVKIN